LFGLLKPKIENESIRELVQALNNVKSFHFSNLHERGFPNEIALVHIKRLVLMAYEEEEEIKLSKLVVKNLNRFLRSQGKIALQILATAIAESRETNYLFQLPNSDEVLDLRKIQIGLHIKHPMHLDETRETYARLFSSKLVEIFGVKEAKKISSYIKNTDDRKLLLQLLEQIKARKRAGKGFGFGSDFLPVKNVYGARACEKILSEAPRDMKAMFPLSDSYFDYMKDKALIIT